MDRKQETTAVKRAIIQAGFDQNNVRVTHGKGTAWGWLTVRADIHHKPECTCVIHKDAPRETCAECKALWSECYNRIEQVAIQASERSAYSAERIGVSLDFFEN